MCPREGPGRSMFGTIDPYCLLAVLPMLFVAGIVGVLVSVPVGLVVAVVAGLIVVFDSWANRPGPVPPVRRPRPSAQAMSAPVRRPRPPAVRPDPRRPRPGVRQPAPGAPYRR
ncbi:hypothetical protein [Amycolatopsis sp. NBRC 101858]|uniref:hypothetical protein n=1 Tax=Amycolatopsis sp. NBRC 101858 TaxID=3032200 RepID=UPI002552B32B|nr:hypothetical protein [Amycolatopsis sp. NBRC 101858]